MREVQPKFTIIEGGLTADPAGMEFRSAWITDTRLMGVFVMGMDWSGPGLVPDLHQLFYFDSEGLGFDRYDSYQGDKDQEYEELEASFTGGLGGSKVSISGREALFLLNKYVDINQSAGIPLPSPRGRYMGLLEALETKGQVGGIQGDPSLSAEEQRALFGKSCVKLNSHYALANYYLMRACGNDRDAMEYLWDGKDPVDPFGNRTPGVFYKNKVDLKGEDKAICESMICVEDKYRYVVTELTFTGVKVSGCRVISSMKLTDMEVYMILNHSEFVTVYGYRGEPEDFTRNSTSLTRRAIISREHQGRSFMIYSPNNQHVEDPEYFLYNDLVGMYHMGDNGELILSSANLKNIRRLEMDVMFANAPHMMEPLGSFEFNEPVVLQYLESDFLSFRDFLTAIQGDED